MLSVVLYHAGIGPAAGFAGVDVFFVISGYLITALLHREWSVTGRIDLFAFYARRFRRLFAALVLVVVTTLLVSACVLSPYGEFRQVALSAAAAFAFASNFFFEMTTGGYFDSSTDKLPLLHLWSLAVEEQFYLLWPVLLMVVLRLRPRSLTPVLVVLTLGSLVLAELLIINNPQAAFYQMPARFWELSIGGLIALRPSGRLQDGRTAASLSLVILIAGVVIPVGHFPGVGALPAVAGAALLLYAVHGTSRLGMAGKCLKSRPMVFFGLISYSLYLWHWPLLALDKATRAGPSPLESRLLLCVAAVLLAWFTYRFVERPFRRAAPGSSCPRVIAAGLSATVALAVATVTLGDFLDREPPASDLASVTAHDKPENQFSCHYRGNESLSIFPKPGCNYVRTTPARVVIWGDSMALAWQPFAWAIGQRTGVSATSYSRDACPPVLDYSNGKRTVEDRLCRKFNSLVVEKIRDVDTLILSARWTTALRPGVSQAADNDLQARLHETIQTVSPDVRNIILLGPTPSLRDTAPGCINASSLDACAVSRREFDAEAGESRMILASLAAQYDKVSYIELADFFCTPEVCPVLKDGYGLYWDSYHVSSTAARKFSAIYLGNI